MSFGSTEPTKNNVVSPVIVAAADNVIDNLSFAIALTVGFVVFPVPTTSSPVLIPVSYTHLTLPTKRIV